jgi:hypothetical protein
MKKILMVFDGINFSETAFDFAKKLNEKEHILLVGAFLPQVSFADLWAISAGAGVTTFPSLEDDEEKELIEKNMERFSKSCQAEGIDYRLHESIYDFTVPVLEKETSFADLMLLDSKLFYREINNKVPNIYLEDTLQHINCPVIVLPGKTDFPKRIILSYDGRDDSVYAIKLFAYLFPELTKLPANLVFITGKQEDFPYKIEMEELVSRHYSDLELTELNMDTEMFSTWLSEKKNALVISGAYSRSDVSLGFKKSFIKDVLKEQYLPVFISHC